MMLRHTVALALLTVTGSALAGPPKIDGDLSDLPADQPLQADGRYIHLRFPLPEPQPPQGSKYASWVQFDLDGDAGTGIAADGMGVDLTIAFSPPKPDGEVGHGVRLFAAPRGVPMQIPHAEVGLIFAPTQAAPVFELRLDRQKLAALNLTPEEPRRVVARSLHALEGEPRVLLEPVGLAIPPRSEADAPSGELPARPPDADLRLASMNVLWSSPLETPAPFARVLRAADPDVILLQEWDKSDAEEIAAWMKKHVDPASDWRAVVGPEGVAIAARMPLTALESARPDQVGEMDRPLKFAAAVVQTGAGPLLAGSVHLSCCGGADGPRERQRIAEVKAVRRLLEKSGAIPNRVVLGGDLNLVGSRRPLDLLSRGMDADGSDLAAAATPVPGARAVYTWVDADQPFTPGRLDWITFSDSTLNVLQGFALDTRRLSDAALEAAALEREDAAATDHLLLVVDLAESAE